MLLIISSSSSSSSGSRIMFIIYARCGKAPPASHHCDAVVFGRGDETVGNPHRAQISQFEFFELTLLLKLDKQLPVERFEATVSQSTVTRYPPPS